MSMSNALVQLQAHYHHCGETAPEKVLISCNVPWQGADVPLM
jgi:hypothetical protein